MPKNAFAEAFLGICIYVNGTRTATLNLAPAFGAYLQFQNPNLKPKAKHYLTYPYMENALHITYTGHSFDYLYMDDVCSENATNSRFIAYSLRIDWGKLSNIYSLMEQLSFLSSSPSLN